MSNLVIKGVLIDLGQTVVSNRVIDFKKGLRAVYDLSSNSDKYSWDEYYETDLKLRKVTFDYARKINTEIRITDFLETLNSLCHLKIDKSIEEIEDVFQKYLVDEELINGVKDFLILMKENNIPVIALSNSCVSSRALKVELNDFGVLDYFNDVISSADIYLRKPRKEIFEYGIGQLRKIDSSIKENQVMFIGNDYNCDIIGSTSCGLIPIWLNAKNEKDELNICEYNVKDYKELMELLIK